MKKVMKKWKGFFALFLAFVLGITVFSTNVLALADSNIQEESTIETEVTIQEDKDEEKEDVDDPLETKDSYISESEQEGIHSQISLETKDADKKNADRINADETDLERMDSGRTVSEEIYSEEANSKQETETEKSNHETIIVKAPVLYAANGATYQIYSDGTWSSGGQSGIIWYVGNKHHVFCLEQGKTMYNGQYSGKVVSGYSGKSAFKKTVAMNYFYKSNGNTWSGTKKFGPAQEVIWDKAESDEAKKLMQYIDYAWELTSGNSERKAGSASFSSKLTPIWRAEQSSKTARKTMIAGIQKMQKINPEKTQWITLSGDAWNYFSDGGYDGNGVDIVVDGVYNKNGEVETGCSATISAAGNLKLNDKIIEKATKENPLTVIMHIDYNSNYQGADSLNYLLTKEGKQNMTYDASWNTEGYFAVKVYVDAVPTGPNPTEIAVNKVDEYGKPLYGCTFEIEATAGEAYDHRYDPMSGNRKLTTSEDDNVFSIEYPGTYVIRETAVPNGGEYRLNTEEVTFYAGTFKLDSGEKLWLFKDEALRNPLINIDLAQGTVSSSYTYTCENKSEEGGARLTKYGTLLVKYEDGKFVYDKQNLSGVGFTFYAGKDIYVNTTKVFSAGQEIKNGITWGKAHKVTISNNNMTDQNGNVTIEGLPLGEYYCLETDYLPGFAKVSKRFDFEVQPDVMAEINGETGIVNEPAPVDVIVTKQDVHGDTMLAGGEFTLYAHVTNKAYNGSALFTVSQTTPAVVKRNLLTGEETIVANEWVRISGKTTGTDGNVNFENLPYGRYLIVETKAPEGYALAEESYEFIHTEETEQGSNGFVFTHTILDEQEKHYYVIKHVEVAEKSEEDTPSSGLYVYHDKPVSGVKFGIFAAEEIHNTLGDKVLSEDEQVGTCETDADGKAVYEGHLYFGTYYFKELQTADDRIYIPDDTEYFFSVSADAQEQINADPVVNRQYRGTIKVIKTDGENKYLLSGVTFDLLDENKQILGSYHTDDKGEIRIENLPVGTYYLQEKGTLQDYYLDREMREVTIDKEHLEQIVNVENIRKKGSIKVIKTDGSLKYKLQGVQFELLNDKDQILGRYTTDENGEINIVNLELGYYYLKETATLKGYRLPEDMVEVAILPENLHRIVQIKNEKEETIIKETPTIELEKKEIRGVGKVKTGDHKPIGLITSLLFVWILIAIVAVLSKKNTYRKK